MALAKQSLNVATRAEESRVFLISQQHIENYNKSYAQHDIHGYGPTRRLVIEDENGQTQIFRYTHTTPLSRAENPDVVKKGYKIDDAEVVWHGPNSKIIYFGVDVHAPRTTPENTL